MTTYKKSVEEIDKFLPAHSAFLDRYYEKKKIIFSGRRIPRVGGLILYNTEKKEEVLEFIAKDPFKQKGIAEYELFEFTPTKYDEYFGNFVHP